MLAKYIAIILLLILPAYALSFNIIGNEKSIILISPVGELSSNNVFFFWKSNKNFILYFLYIGNDKNQMKLAGITVLPFYRLRLEEEKTYFWKVVGFDGKSMIESEIKKFEIKIKNEWTFMLYLNGDNDLYTYALRDFNKIKNMSTVANVAILFDGNGNNDSFLYCFSNSSKNFVKLNEINMGDGATLESFIEYVRQIYPAKHYILEIWGHGNLSLIHI